MKILSSDGLRLYGAAIASSATESRCCLDDAAPNRLGFDVERVLRTHYRIDDFQETYFVINGLDALLNLAQIDFAPLYQRAQGQRVLPPGVVLDSDRVLQRGTRRYHQARRR